MSGSVRHSLKSSQEVTECQYQKVEHLSVTSSAKCNGRLRTVNRLRNTTHERIGGRETYPNSY